ncbi:MAG: FtsQ-type POTRA domain-containing protein [Anaerolineales bacterium]|nr:FtsQ-type POTRA domain-containing protein [Anaerolineales bacterium]
MSTKTQSKGNRFVRNPHQKGPEGARRRPETRSRTAYRPETVSLPGEPRSRRMDQNLEPVYRKPPRSHKPRQAQPKSQARQKGQRFDIAFTLGQADVRAPGISLPRFSPRWVSAALTALLAFVLYTLWTSASFTLGEAEIIGNQRLGAPEVNAAIRLAGRPVFEAVPAQAEAALRASYPDLASAEVHIGFPNKIVVVLAERTPVIAWYQDGALTWIDTTGVAFPPRGTVEGLVTIHAGGTPPTVAVPIDTPAHARPYLAPEMVRVMLDLALYVPAGTQMLYDPQYGLGWQDPRGWFVYFGQNTDEIPMKLVAYQAIVDALTSGGIQPTLISMEYLDAPFYK